MLENISKKVHSDLHLLYMYTYLFTYYCWHFNWYIMYTLLDVTFWHQQFSATNRESGFWYVRMFFKRKLFYLFQTRHGWPFSIMRKVCQISLCHCYKMPYISDLSLLKLPTKEQESSMWSRDFLDCKCYARQDQTSYAANSWVESQKLLLQSSSITTTSR